VICPYCGEDNDKVIDSRASDGGMVVRRRRECLACEKRYTTYERVERAARLMVVKKDGSRVPFDPQNMIRGIQAACGKRPVSEQAKQRIVRDIDDEIHREFDREVPSVEIGKRVVARLREVDPIAYIRYASEYYDFRTLDDFSQELSELKSRAPNLPNQQDLFPLDAPPRKK
jgi:transcriptional repressor NrdR